MTRTDSLLNADWQSTVERLGGAAYLTETARETKAFVRAREFPDALVMLRTVLAYCLGKGGLRLTSAWAAAVGLVNVSNVALLYRLKQCAPWLEQMVGRLLAAHTTVVAKGRLIRLIDATTVPKAACAERSRNGVWRIHSAFDLPSERFGHLELTEQDGGEQLDRIPVVKGEIRIADAAYLQPQRIAQVIARGADIIVRVAWRNGRWLNAEDDKPFDFIAAFKAATNGVIDQAVRLHRQGDAALKLRLVGAKLPPEKAEVARRRVRRAAQKAGYTLSDDALNAADWVLMVTSLDAESFATTDVLALYRLRWRVELAFKRLKSVIGLKGPPGADKGTARTFILAHLLMILLLEPLADGFEDSPHWNPAV
jgi:hypothetical protein